MDRAAKAAARSCGRRSRSSLVTGTPFRIENIRARRAAAGLMRQHLTAVQRGRAIGKATRARRRDRVAHARVRADGDRRRASIASPSARAGSATLVLQTILPALLRAPAPSTLVVEGGTHNPLAPPFEFLERVFLPLLRRWART